MKPLILILTDSPRDRTSLSATVRKMALRCRVSTYDRRASVIRSHHPDIIVAHVRSVKELTDVQRWIRTTKVPVVFHGTKSVLSKKRTGTAPCLFKPVSSSKLKGIFEILLPATAGIPEKTERIPPGLTGKRTTDADPASAQEKVQGSQQIIEGILNCTTEGIIAINEDQRIVLFNHGAEVLFGYAGQEVLGQPLGILLPYGMRDRHVGLADGFLHSVSKSMEAGKRKPLPCRRKDGSEFLAEISLSAYRDGKTRLFTAVVRDVSEVHRLLEKYRIIADNTYDWEFWLTPERQYAYTSPSCEMVTGYAAEEFMKDPNLDFRIVHPEDAGAFREHQHGVFEQPQAASIEFRIIRRDGQVRWIGHVCQPIYGDDHRFLGVRGSNRDITERKLAEQQLQISQSSYQGIINSITEAVYLQDENGVFVDVNQAAVNLYGYPREYFIGRTPEFLSAPGKNDLAKVGEHVRKALEGTAQRFEFWGLRKDGSVFPKDVSLSPGTYFGKKIVIALARNITERKRAEEQLRASEEKHRILAETSRDIVVLYDLDGRILYANPAIEKLLGYSEEDLKVRTIFDIMAPAGMPAAMERQRLRTSGDLMMQQYEIDLITKGGHTIPFEVSTTVATTTGQPLVVSVARDIRERRKAEASLKDQLRFAQALNRMQEAIMKSDQSREEMLASMVQVIGEALDVERCLVFDVNLTVGKVRSLAKWMGQGIVDFSPGAETYDVSLFTESAKHLIEKAEFIISHRDERHPVLVSEGSASVIHDQLKVSSLLWYPFGQRTDGCYLMVFNQITTRRTWRPEELDFVNSVSKQISIALMKMQLVAERREAEQFQLAAEERYRVIFDNVVEGVFQSSPQGAFIVANSSLAGILGYESPDELTKKMTNIEKQLYVNPDRRTEMHKILHEHGQIVDFESEVYRKDGSRIWISENIRLVRNPSGKPAYYEGTVIDITDRKIVERKLIETLKEFETLTEGIPDAIFFKDGMGRWLITNAAAKKLFRLDGVDWYGKTDRELSVLQPELASAYGASIASDNVAWEKGQRSVGLEIVLDESGRPQYLQTVKIPLFNPDGNRMGLVIIAHDVTLERQTQETIKEQEILLDNAKDAIVVSDLDYHVLYWNQSAEKLYEWDREEAVGRHLLNLLSGPAHHAQDTLSEILRVGGWSGELVHVSRSGREILVESRQSLIKDLSGQPKSILFINTDITEKKKLEQQFLRAQRMESIGRMASGIAHDLNNILSPILMSVQIFKERVPDAALQKLIPLLESNVQRGADLMKKLLMFTRGVEGKYVRIDIKKVISEIENITRSTFPKNISVVTIVPDNLWDVRGDVTHLHQIFLNLCVNARDAMDQGGQLTIEADNVVFGTTHVTPDPELKPGRYVHVRVTDTGTGIQPEVLDQIFEPFFSTKGLESGTGLGLSTVSALVKAHDGVINVESDVGKGTSFRIYLPAMDTLQDASPSAGSSALTKGRGEWILVVDDEPPIRKTLTAILESHNYRIVEARDGQEALERFRANPDIQIVITDMSMPRLGGADLIRELRSQKPELRIVAMSGLPDHHADMGTIDGFLMKPYEADKVLRLVSSILKGS